MRIEDKLVIFPILLGESKKQIIYTLKVTYKFIFIIERIA